MVTYKCKCGADITEYEVTNYGGRCEECELEYLSLQSINSRSATCPVSQKANQKASPKVSE